MTIRTLSIAAKPTLAHDIRQRIVEDLKEVLLKLAEAGEIESSVIIFKRMGDGWSDRRSGSLNFPDSIGRLEIVKQAWIAEYLRQE